MMNTKTNKKAIDQAEHSLPMTLEATEMLKPSFNGRVYKDLMAVKKERAEKERLQSRLFYFIGLSISLLMCLIVINWKTYEQTGIMDLGTLETDFDDMMEIPISEQPPPPPPKDMQTAVIVEVADEEIIEEIDFEVDVEMSEGDVVEQHNIDFTVEITEEKEEIEEIFQIVETYPEPAGGMSTFYTYVSENLSYPPKAARLNVSGIVFLQFVVEKDGQITNIKVIKGIGAGCDEEAVRVLEGAPDWKPGRQRGRNVRVYMTVPIRFVLK